MNNDELWVKFLNNLEGKLASVSFNCWFKDANFLDIVDNTLVFSVANDYYRTYINTYYADLLDEIIEELNIGLNGFKLLIPEEIEKNEVVEPVKVKEEPIITNKYKEFNSNLNPKYTFGSFVVGDSNRFPQTAALMVAEQPGKIYNPLFIWGKSGLGKTHLMHAIGNFIQESSDKTVLYVTSETFISDFSMINKKDDNKHNYDLIEHFKDKYRNVDVLIIDDIQFLKGATKTQEEFFNTFNFLHTNNKQIIISSDRSADDLKVLEERLTTRFTWGLTVQINPPDRDLRLKILKSKITGHEVGSLIKPEVIEYIANNSESDVRHLEGAINRLYAVTAMYSPTEINLEFAQMALKDYFHSSVYITNSVAKIAKAVADYYDLTVENLKSKKRTANINKARQIAMYLCKMTTEETIEKIGLEFNRDHSTVIHACNVIEEEYKEKEELRDQIKAIKEKIAN